MHILHARIARPAPEIVARYKAVWSECVVQALADPRQLLDPAIKPLVPKLWSFVGPALTVSPGGTDPLMGIAATGVAEPGDVIVVAARGDCRAGSWGGGLTFSAKNKGVAGVVVDGAVMDAPAILDHEVPVFCRTAVMAHQIASQPGSVNVPVTCGGVAVEPGDLVFANFDGVLVVPKARLLEVLDIAEEKTARLVAAKRRLYEGSTLFEMRGGRTMIEGFGVKWVE